MPRRRHAVVSPVPLMVNPQPLNCLEIYFKTEPVSISKPGSQCRSFRAHRPHHAAILSRMDQKGHARPLARLGASPTTTHLSTSPMRSTFCADARRAPLQPLRPSCRDRGIAGTAPTFGSRHIRHGASPTATHLSTSPMSGRKWAMCPSCGDSLSRLGIVKDRALTHHQK